MDAGLCPSTALPLPAGLHWKLLPRLPSTAEVKAAIEHQLSAETWTDPGVRWVGPEGEVNAGCGQLIMMKEGFSVDTTSRALEGAVKHGKTLSDSITKTAGKVICPACNTPMSKHDVKENFLSRMEVGSQLRYHTDNSAYQTTVSLMLHPASSGGLLRVSATYDGKLAGAGVPGSHIGRDTDTILLNSTG